MLSSVRQAFDACLSYMSTKRDTLKLQNHEFNPSRLAPSPCHCLVHGVHPSPGRMGVNRRDFFCSRIIVFIYNSVWNQQLPVCQSLSVSLPLCVLYVKDQRRDGPFVSSVGEIVPNTGRDWSPRTVINSPKDAVIGVIHNVATMVDVWTISKSSMNYYVQVNIVVCHGETHIPKQTRVLPGYAFNINNHYIPIQLGWEK